MTSVEDLKSVGDSSYKDKNYAEAIRAYSAAIDLQPDFAMLYLNRAAAHIMLLQHKESVADCDRALAIDNTLAKAYFRKASSMRGLGRLDSAIDCLTVGLKYEPTNSSATKDLRDLSASKGRLAELAELVQGKNYRKALPLAEALSRDLGGNFREVC